MTFPHVLFPFLPPPPFFDVMVFPYKRSFHSSSLTFQVLNTALYVLFNFPCLFMRCMSLSGWYLGLAGVVGEGRGQGGNSRLTPFPVSPEPPCHAGLALRYHPGELIMLLVAMTTLPFHEIL